MGAFVVPDASEPFEFVVGHGKSARSYSVPRLLDLSPDDFEGVVDRIASAEDANRQGVAEARAVFERYAPGSLDGLTMRQLGALADAWVNEGGDDVGEGSSSSE